MRYGVVLPGGMATDQFELAILAEQTGWDGVFVWEAAYGVDAWTLLAAMATRTSRVRLGTMLTPLPWRRPWKVASQVVTLDQLSDGRAILAVGLGALGVDLPSTGEETDLRGRAERLDEGIDLIRALWDGATSFRGSHYGYQCERNGLMAVAHPVQEHIPLWVVGAWPRPRSMARVLRCDGVIPQYRSEDDATPGEVRDLRAWLTQRGGGRVLDVIAQGETSGDDHDAAASQVLPWAEAGCTWWLETCWGEPETLPARLALARQRVAAGPPAIMAPRPSPPPS